MQKRLFSFLFLTIIVIFLSMVTFVGATDLDNQIDELTKKLEALTRDLQSKEANLQKQRAQLEEIKTRVTYLESEIQKKEAEVQKGEKVLAYQKTLLDGRVLIYYKNLSKAPNSLLNFIIAENLSESLQNFFYQKTLVDEDRKTIIKIVLYIKNLEETKASLEGEKTRLSALKLQIDKQSQILSGEISSTKQQIAQLSTRQQELIAQKLASLNIPRSAGVSMGGCVDDRDIDPGFSPRFAFFTFGVPNRTGLNQWGAYGRAKDGQNEEQILRAYYEFDSITDYNTNINITVEGYTTYSLEDYMRRIYEVPDSWDANNLAALKAQAIAARSYVLAYTNDGQNSICSTDHCQVFRPDPKGGNWERAVNETQGKVMVQGGKPIKAWFSSTHGGYILKSGELPGWSDTSWTKHGSDTREGVGNLSDLRDSNKAYDKESPWFYCDWGSRPEYNKTAWFKSEEVADVANVIMLANANSSALEHLYQVDRGNPAGTDTWGFDRVKEELRKKSITPFNSVSDVSVSADIGAGRTTTVTIIGDAGSQPFDGKQFKDYFNLRAPASIQIVGPLYNVEKR